jgi:glucose/arabinose dehydrogenase
MIHSCPALQHSISIPKDCPALTRLSTISCLLFLLLAPALSAATLPGFGATQVASTNGLFLTSAAIDSHGRLYYTTQNGGIFRVDGSTSLRVATVDTLAISDSGLLGMALRNDSVAVVHYTDPKLSMDILADVDLATGAVTMVQAFICDITLPGRACSGEHHGGNPIVAPDGSVYFGIGDYNGRISNLPEWNGGKIWRIASDGSATQYARGFRNPFDMAWLPGQNFLVVGDNGVFEDDEINYVTPGNFYGWPQTSGNLPPIEGATPPVYVWPAIVAPTGMVAMSGRNPLLPSGLLVGTFKTKSIEYFPQIGQTPLPAPITLFTNPDAAIIDVIEGPQGEVFFATAFGIYRLLQPKRGDCNGDGKLDYDDYLALGREVDEGPHSAITAQDGAYRGSWGCDADGSGTIDGGDLPPMLRMITKRVRVSRK